MSPTVKKLVLVLALASCETPDREFELRLERLRRQHPFQANTPENREKLIRIKHELDSLKR